MAALFLVTALIVPATTAAADDVGSVGGTVSVPGGHDVTGVDLYLASSDGASVVAGPVHPDGAGAYAFAGVADGTYTVFAEAPSDTLAWQWSGGGRDVSEATTVSVFGGAAITGVDFALVVGASISGTITVPAGFSPEDSGAFADRPAGSPALAPAGTTTAGGQYAFAGADGSYTIAGLPNLSWLVRFPTTGHTLLVQYYPGAYSVDAATTFSPSVGQALTGIDATLEEIANLRIAATFKDAGSSLCYAYHNADSSITGSECTDAGVIEASIQVRPGDYVVSAYESNPTHGVTPTLWWNDTAADRTVQANATAFTPDPLSVDPGAVASFDFTGLLWPGDPIPGGITFALTNWADGSPATGGCMQVFDASQVQVAQDCTGYAGTYRVGPLADGSYRVKFANFTGAAPTQWYGPAATFAAAKPIVIAGATGFTGTYVVLQPYSVAGKVVDGAGHPLTGGYAEVWNSYSTGRPETRVAVAPDGTFATGTVSCGSYCVLRLTGFSGLGDQWRGFTGNVPQSLGASMFTATASAPAVLGTMTLSAVEGVLAGTIVAPGSFTSSRVCVILYERSASGSKPLGYQCGEPGDPFAFRNLAATTYALCVADTADPASRCAGSSYSWDFYGEKDASRATSLSVAAGATTTAALVFGGTITSTPTVSGGGSLSGGCMDVYDGLSGPLVGSDCTPVSGSFSVSVSDDSDTLPGGAYTVDFRDFTGGLDEWYSNGYSQATAAGLAVRAGATVSLPVGLAPWGSIGGTITLPGGVSPEGACVLVFDAAGTYGEGPVYGPECNDPATGAYAIAVPPGSYQLLFYGAGTGAATLWYGGTAARAHATHVAVASGATIAANASLPGAAQISGTVSLAGGGTASAGEVDIYTSGGDFVTWVSVDGSGHYSVPDLPAGTYNVYFTGYGEWAGQWYDATSFWDEASDVTLATGGAVAIDATLEAGATLSGVVTAPGGGPATGGCAELYDASGSHFTQLCVDASGAYSGVIPAGTYTVLFSGFHDSASQPLASEWSGDAANYASAAHVSLAAGGSATSDAQLAAGGAVTGITSERGYPARLALGGCVAARDPQTLSLVDFSCVNGAGAFNLYLSAGTYLLEFRGFTTMQGRVLLDSWYAASGSVEVAALATPITVTRGGSLSVTGYISVPGSIYGTVVLPAGALMNGRVEAYDLTTGTYIAGVDAASDGTFRIEGLKDGGHYQLWYGGFTGAGDVWTGGNPAFYNGTNATWVTASEAGTNAGSRTLHAEGRITGTFPSPPTLGSSICVTVWTMDWYYVTEVCGHSGDPMVISNLEAWEWMYYYLAFTDSAGHSAYYSWWGDWTTPTPVWVTAGSSTAIVMAPALAAHAVTNSVLLGDWAGATVKVNVPPVSGSVYLQYLLNGAWTTLTAPQPLSSDGWAPFAWKPTQTYQYRAVYGTTVSAPFTITVVVPTVTGTADSASIPAGGPAGATVTVSPDPGSRTVSLQYLNGSTWTAFATPVTLEYGSAHFSWVPPQTFQYRAVYGTTYSAPFTITVVPPTVVGTADSASIPAGGTAGATVTVSPVPGSGTASLEYLKGSVWTPFGTPVTLSGGSAHFSWVPPQTFQYRAVFGTTYSEVFTITVVPPTVVGTADSASIPAGGAAGATVTVDPVPGSGTASLEYLKGSTWTPFGTPVTLSGGSAHFSWVPPQTFQYRAVFGTTYSEVFTITVTPPTVVGTADSASIPAGGAAGATVTVSPVPGSGTASLEYLKGSVWTPFGTPVTLSGGSAHFSWVPPQTFQYRAVFGTTYSEVFTITVVPPTVVGTADSASIPAGGTAGATVTVSPVPGSGTASLEYLKGSVWTPFGTPVTLSGGSAHFSWVPPQTFQYRAVYGTTYSAPFTITVVPPTVVGTADSASIPGGGAAGATVTVDPDPGSATARLEYLKGSVWTPFATPVTLVRWFGSFLVGAARNVPVSGRVRHHLLGGVHDRGDATHGGRHGRQRVDSCGGCGGGDGDGGSCPGFGDGALGVLEGFHLDAVWHAGDPQRWFGALQLGAAADVPVPGRVRHHLLGGLRDHRGHRLLAGVATGSSKGRESVDSVTL